MNNAAAIADAGVAPPPAGPLFLTPQEVGGILGVNRGALRDLRDHGQGPHYYTIGAAIRYRASDVEAYREQRDRERQGGRSR